jgi:hypothetical protein
MSLGRKRIEAEISSWVSPVAKGDKPIKPWVKRSETLAIKNERIPSL